MDAQNKEIDDLIGNLIGTKKKMDAGVYKIPVRATSKGEVLDDGYKPTIIGTFIPDKYLNPMHPTGHNGVDLQAPQGTPIYALGPGIVIKKTEETADTNKIGGNTISIKHTTEPNMTSYYAHMEKNIPVNIGDKVDQNTVIGRVGKSGNARYTSAHLHFETKINNQNVDPFSVIGKPFEFTAPKKSNEKAPPPEDQIKVVAQLYLDISKLL